MIVPIPPRFAPTATATISPRPNRLPFGNLNTTGVVTATIIAAVAVFDINMLNTKVTPITPSTSHAGRPATRLNKIPANQRSSCVLVQACASTNPPKNNHMIPDDHGATNISHPEASPSSTNTPPGRPNKAICTPITSNATANAGIASLIHNAAAKIITPSDTCPASLNSAYHPKPNHSGSHATPNAKPPDTSTLIIEATSWRSNDPKIRDACARVSSDMSKE